MVKLLEEEKKLFEVLKGELRELFRKEGHGSKKRILETLGTNSKAYDMAMNHGTLKLLVLHRILAALEVDPGEFFSRVFPRDRLEPPGIPPVGVLRAYEAMHREREKREEREKAGG